MRFLYLARQNAISRRSMPRFIGAAVVEAACLIAETAIPRRGVAEGDILISHSNIGDQIRMMNVASRVSSIHSIDVACNIESAEIFSLYENVADVIPFRWQGGAMLPAALRGYARRSARYGRALVPMPFVTQPLALALGSVWAKEAIAIQMHAGHRLTRARKTMNVVPLVSYSWQGAFEAFFRAAYPTAEFAKRPAVKMKYRYRGAEATQVFIHALSLANGRNMPKHIARSVARQCIDEGLSVVAVGSRAQAEKVADVFSDLPVTIRCGLRISEVAELMAESKIFVGIDSSMMHLADAVGIPAVVMYGPTSPISSGPFQTKLFPVEPREPRYIYGVDSDDNGAEAHSIVHIREADANAAVSAAMRSTQQQHLPESMWRHQPFEEIK